MTSKNDLMNKLRAERMAQNVRLIELESELSGIARRLTALEGAQVPAGQLIPATDPDELHNLRVGNDQLLFQNSELTAANRRISEISTKRWKEIQDLRAENARLRELLAVTDQHAGEIVRALAVAEGENK